MGHSNRAALLGKVSPAGVVTAAYAWGADGLVSEHLSPTSGSPQSLWYLFGPQGETRQLTNSTGQVVDSYSYTAWGQALSSSGSDVNPFQYGGKYGYYTEAGGAVLCGHRWYDTATLRWLSRDPIGYNGGDNLYAYCGGNPVNESDPSGCAKVEVYYRRVFGPGFHSFIVVTDLNGKQYEIAGANGSDLNIDVRWGPYKKGAYDWPGASGKNDTAASRPAPNLLINDNKPASYYMCRFASVGALINGSVVTYEPLGDNSNTTIKEIIVNSGTGLTPPSRQKRPVWTPGWDNTLPVSVPGWH